MNARPLDIPRTVMVDADAETIDAAVMLQRVDGFGGHVWEIGNEYGRLGFVVANNEQDACDEAVDRGLLNSMMMDDETHAEYLENDWDVTYLGNAGEPFNTDYLSLRLVLESPREAY